MLFLVMGVTGCGKTSVGQALAQELSIPFYDADDFHPPANREKLARDEPLNDTDRQPWLDIVRQKIAESQGTGDAVLACSALKKRYRRTLLDENGPSEIIY